MSLKSFAKSLVLNRIDDHSPPGLAKGVILFGVMAMFLIAGFIAYLPTFVAALKEGRILLCIVFTLLYILLLLFFVVRPITFNARSFLLCIIILVTGITSFYAAELMSSARLWFVFASLLACLLLGFRWALIFALVSFAFMLIYGMTGDFTVSMPQESDFSVWVIILSTFILIQFVVLGAISLLVKALRQSESYYRTIFEASGSAMLIVEEDTMISLANSNFEELSGYSRQEIEGKKSWNDFVHSGDVASWKQERGLQRSSPADAPGQYEIRLLTYQGEERDVFLSLDTIPETNQSIISCVDITKRKQMEKKLKEMSFRDSLTGLYNRNLFEIEMERLNDGRYSPIGIVICDLDGLKFVNDTLGHQAGDQMLIQTASILRDNFRSSDIIARIGGDEFAILLTETDSLMAEKVVQRLSQAVREHNSTDPEIPLSLSMGYAVDEGGKANMHALFREADNRMYREKLQREGSARSAILQALTVSMEARDFNTENHCDRLRELAASIALSLRLSQDLVNDLYLLARFHDLGKVGIPDHILYKPGALTEVEWRQMRQHCEIGHRIASSVPDLKTIADYILKHHERWDGRGYPLGLSGEDIPLPCRILAIADAYDAMTSDRPYRKAMTREEAMAELRRCAGTQFDPELVEKFIEIMSAAGSLRDTAIFSNSPFSSTK